MAEKTLSERYQDLLEKVEDLEGRVIMLERQVDTLHLPSIEQPSEDVVKRRGNPNWVKK